MKTNTLLLVGGAALLVYLLTRRRRRQRQPQSELTPEQRESVKQITDTFKSGGFRIR